MNNNNNRQAIPIDAPPRFAPRVNNETRQNNTMSLELSKLKALIADTQKSTEEFKLAIQQEMAKKDDQIRGMTMQMHEMAFQMHTMQKEMDGMKTMAKKMMAGTSIGRAPGRIAKHAIRVSLESLKFCFLVY